MNTTYKMTWEVLVTCDDNVSMNNATDAVSFGLFQIGNDGELVSTLAVQLLTAEEVPL